MTSKTHGPHRRNKKSEYQECTCKMDKSLNRGMFNKSESRNIYVAGYQCDHREPTQSVCVADCYFIVNVLDLPFASPIAIYR